MLDAAAIDVRNCLGSCLAWIWRGCRQPHNIHFGNLARPCHHHHKHNFHTQFLHSPGLLDAVQSVTLIRKSLALFGEGRGCFRST